MILKSKINNYPVSVESVELPIGKCYTLTIKDNSAIFEILVLMLRTVSKKSRFFFCNQEVSYDDWLCIYNEIKQLK